MTPEARRRALSLAVASLGCVLLLYNQAAARAGTRIEDVHRRYWEDLAIAAGEYLASQAPSAPLDLNHWRGQELLGSYERVVARAVEESGIRPWQFWRRIRLGRFLGIERLVGRESDDPGRAVLLRLGFHALGGVSPFLLLWLGTLLAIPVLLWAAWELADAGWPVCGSAFPLVFASFPYAVEVLSLPYSAVGFYLLGLLGLVPLAAYAALGRCRSRALFALRLLAGGTCFALCMLCRGGALLLLPGFALAVLLAAARVLVPVGPARAVRVFLVSAAALALFLVPYTLVRQPRHHEVWLGLWEGLGDFDRTKGHAWSDTVAKDALEREGVALRRKDSLLGKAAGTEAIFRRLVLADVREDPLWYARILGRRLFATVTQQKLWPWGPRDGATLALRSSPNEGHVDVYYRLTTRVDWVSLGPWRAEVPVSALLAPTALLLAVGLRGRRRPLLVLLCLALAALGLPVLVTTAAAFETQAFALVYLVGFGFFLEEAARLRYRRSARQSVS